MEKKADYSILSVFFGIVAFFVVVLLCVQSCESKQNDKYDSAYWRSIEREKQFKDAGLDEYAKREKRERRKRLRSR